MAQAPAGGGIQVNIKNTVFKTVLFVVEKSCLDRGTDFCTLVDEPPAHAGLFEKTTSESDGGNSVRSMQAE